MAGWMDRLLGRQERSLWHRADGDDMLAKPLVGGDPGVVWIGSDQWPGVLGRSAAPEGLPVTTRATSLITGPLTAAPYLVVDDETGGAVPTPRWLGDPMLLRPDEMEAGREVPQLGELTAFMGLVSCPECLQWLLDEVGAAGVPFECEGCGEMTDHADGMDVPGWRLAELPMSVMARVCGPCLGDVAG